MEKFDVLYFVSLFHTFGRWVGRSGRCDGIMIHLFVHRRMLSVRTGNRYNIVVERGGGPVGRVTSRALRQVATETTRQLRTRDVPNYNVLKTDIC